MYFSDLLIKAALGIAIVIGRSAYDSLYVALAVEADAVAVTADQRLVNALADGPLEEYVRWLGDVE